MKKVHQSPEFQIIIQNQANAKFFVASGGGFENSSSATGDNVPTNSSSRYDYGGGFSL